MSETDYIEACPADSKRRLRIPLQVEPTGEVQGFGDNERGIWWGYDEEGRLYIAQDFFERRDIYPPKKVNFRAGKHGNMGGVYFIQDATGQIKIGISKNCGSRLKKLAAASPVHLELKAVVEGGPSLEREYHARFAAHRLHGEWFEPHEDILAEIARLTSGTRI